jgi:hypothetical protein
MSMTGKISRSRSVNFCTLPVAVVASGPNTTDFGALKYASLSRLALEGDSNRAGMTQ